MTTQMTHIVPACRKTPHPASPTSIFLGCPTDLLWLRMPEAERWHAICPCAVVGEQLALTTGQGFGYRGPSALKTQAAHGGMCNHGSHYPGVWRELSGLMHGAVIPAGEDLVHPPSHT